MKGKVPHPRLLSPEKLSFRMEGQIKSFPDKVKLKEFIITKLLLYEMLRDFSKKKKMIKNMNSKMTTNNYLKLNLKKQKQTTRTGVC